MITAIILSYAWYFVIPILLIGAVLSYIYVPIVGHIGAIALVACASALGAYELGYADRGKLDQTAQLQEAIKEQQAVIAQDKITISNANEIAAEVADRQKKAEALASDLQSKVSDYEKTLKDQSDGAGQTDTQTIVVHDGSGKECPPIPRARNSCLLTPADVSGLRSIRSNRPTIITAPAPASAR